MGWADSYIAKLKNKETVQFRPRGNSMTPRITSGQLVTVSPVKESLKCGDVVLCKVYGNSYLHLVKAIESERVLIGNNHGKINGWTNIKNVFGIANL